MATAISVPSGMVHRLVTGELHSSPLPLDSKSPAFRKQVKLKVSKQRLMGEIPPPSFNNLTNCYFLCHAVFLMGDFEIGLYL